MTDPVVISSKIKNIVECLNSKIAWDIIENIINEDLDKGLSYSELESRMTTNQALLDFHLRELASVGFITRIPKDGINTDNEDNEHNSIYKLSSLGKSVLDGLFSTLEFKSEKEGARLDNV